jgi:hypothetical protein
MKGSEETTGQIVSIEEIDEGVRHVVQLLWSEGFTTTDSGDGKKDRAEMGCALDFPHVVVDLGEPPIWCASALADTVRGQLDGWSVDVHFRFEGERSTALVHKQDQAKLAAQFEADVAIEKAVSHLVEVAMLHADEVPDIVLDAVKELIRASGAASE